MSYNIYYIYIYILIIRVQNIIFKSKHEEKPKLQNLIYVFFYEHFMPKYIFLCSKSHEFSSCRFERKENADTKKVRPTQIQFKSTFDRFKMFLLLNFL